MNTLIVQLSLLEPVLVTAPGGDPNSNLTLPYIPGSALRGALIRRYLDEHPGETTPPDWLLSGKVRFLNAYPSSSGERLLPTPAALVQDKQTLHRIVNRLAAEPPGMIKSVGAHFSRITGEALAPAEFLDEIAVHNTRDRRLGRAGSAELGQEGSVFQYQALARGTVFRAAILFDDGPENAGTQIERLLTASPLQMGGSASASYGLVKAEALPEHGWKEAGKVQSGIHTGEPFALFLLSDTLTRGPEGQHGDFIVEALNERLGAGSVRREAAYNRLSWVGGFNRKWGLPLPQEWAVQAGGSYRLVAERDITQTELEAVIWEGLGERRADGFGRVAFGAIPQPDRAVAGVGLEIPAVLQRAETIRQDRVELGRIGELSEAENRLADKMVERWLRQKLDRATAAAVNQLIGAGASRAKVSNSQIARLRIQCREASRQGNLKPLSDHLTLVDHRSAARDQLQKVRVGGRSLLVWLKGWIAKDGSSPEIWSTLQVQEIAEPSIGKPRGKDWQQDPKLQVEYTLRLVDGVLARLMKQGRN